MNNIEVMIACILPSDPVANSKTSMQKKVTIADSTSGVTFLSRRDNDTGVDLQFHAQKEFQALTKKQKNALTKQRNKNPEQFNASKKCHAKVPKGNEKKKTKENEKFSKAQLAQVQSVLDKSLKSKEEEEETEVDK